VSTGLVYAIPLAVDTGGGYVAAAYLAFVALLLVYLGIMSVKLVRLQRGLGELQKRTRKRDEN
jgi:hypothetical protein